MRRIVLVAAAVFAALGMAGTAAFADQTPVGNLGKPDVFKAGGTWSPTEWGTILWTSTAACTGFASGGTLTFPEGTWSRIGKEWRNPELEYGYWLEATTKLDASTVVGSFRYDIRGDVYQETPYEYSDFYGRGKVTIHRSDGARIAGAAHVFENELLNRLEVEWQGTPTCK